MPNRELQVGIDNSFNSTILFTETWPYVHVYISQSKLGCLNWHGSNLFNRSGKSISTAGISILATLTSPGNLAVSY